MRPTRNSAAGRGSVETCPWTRCCRSSMSGAATSGPRPTGRRAWTNPSIQTELRLALTAAIDELPAGSRTMLVLRDVEGLSNVEIAEVLGLSVPVVKTRVHRARLFLRKQLGDVMTTLDAPRATQPARE